MSCSLRNFHVHLVVFGRFRKKLTFSLLPYYFRNQNLTYLSYIVFKTKKIYWDKKKATKPPYLPVTHVIFDLDGTLLATEQLYTVLYTRVLECYGKKLSVELRSQLFGKTGRDSCNILIKALNLSATIEEMMAKVTEFRESALENIEAKPGAECLVKHLYDNNIPIAIATSSSIASFNFKTKGHKELFKYFTNVVTAGSDPEVKEGKPAPDAFLVAARRFPDKPSVEQCLVFEDSVAGVAGARSAGMQVVMVPEGYLSESIVKAANATLIIRSLLDFKPEEFGLPPFPNTPCTK